MSNSETTENGFPIQPEDVVFVINIEVGELEGGGRKFEMRTSPQVSGGALFFDSSFVHGVLGDNAEVGSYCLTVGAGTDTLLTTPNGVSNVERSRMMAEILVEVVPLWCRLMSSIKSFPDDEQIRQIASGIFDFLVDDAFERAVPDTDPTLPSFEDIEIGCGHYLIGEHASGRRVGNVIAHVVTYVERGKIYVGITEYCDPFRDFLTSELVRRVQCELRGDIAGIVTHRLALTLVARRRERERSQAIMAKYSIDRTAVQEEIRRIELATKEESARSDREVLRRFMKDVRLMSLDQERSGSFFGEGT